MNPVGELFVLGSGEGCLGLKGSFYLKKRVEVHWSQERGE